jgi:hypothetical protein
MKLSKCWWLDSDENIISQILAAGLPAPHLVCGIPFSDLLRLAKERLLIIEWISSNDRLMFKIGSASDEGINSSICFGAGESFDRISDSVSLKTLALNFEMPGNYGSRLTQVTAKQNGYDPIRCESLRIFYQPMPKSKPNPVAKIRQAERAS